MVMDMQRIFILKCVLALVASNNCFKQTGVSIVKCFNILDALRAID